MRRARPSARSPFLVVLLFALAPMLGGMEECGGPMQPPQPATGPGSADRYIATTIAQLEAGEVTAGDSTKVTWFVPNVLKDGPSAPVVVFLHGFSAGNPTLYQSHIAHIARQGIIVVFPHFNARNPLLDLDQNVMVERIVANANAAFAELGATADLSQLYLYGHSAGAAFGSVWEHNGGTPALGSVLANPSVGTETIPVPIPIVEVDYEAEAASTSGPVVLLTGDVDAIAPPYQAVNLFGFLTGTPSTVLWQATSDETGTPSIDAGHGAALSDEDTLDWRYYWSALDQMLDGDPTPSFAMGAWSDGTPVAPPTLLAE